MFGADSIDLVEETLDGMGTFHATQMVTFQRGKVQHQHEEELSLDMTISIKIPEECCRLEHPILLPRLGQPHFSDNINELWYIPDQDIAGAVSIKDVTRLIARIGDIEGNTVRVWTGFNQLTIKGDHRKLCKTGYFPLHQHTKVTLLDCHVMYEAFRNHESRTINCYNFWSAVVLCMNAKLCQTICIPLGGFHIAKNFMQAIGQHFTDSGLPEVWIESAYLVYKKDSTEQHVSVASPTIEQSGHTSSLMKYCGKVCGHS